MVRRLAGLLRGRRLTGRGNGGVRHARARPFLVVPVFPIHGGMVTGFRPPNPVNARDFACLPVDAEEQAVLMRVESFTYTHLTSNNLILSSLVLCAGFLSSTVFVLHCYYRQKTGN